MVDSLYPYITPFKHGFLNVDTLHRIYWEQSGNPNGIPVIFLHGGPGGGTNPTHRRYFDPQHYLIILFDQRGSGKSTPYAEIKNNTTWDLVDDIEKLRLYLGVKKWVIYGGSWGVTLAIAYGETYPNNCLGFVLRSIFLGRRQELDWFLDGVQNIFPEASDRLRNFLPRSERKNLLANFYKRLMDPNNAIHLPAAQAWNNYEAECSTLIPKKPNKSGYSSLALARIEVHYFINEMFLKDQQLFDRLHLVKKLPAIIIQGRYDIICPFRTAFELASNWPNAILKTVAESGHSASEAGIQINVIEAMNTMRQTIPQKIKNVSF